MSGIGGVSGRITPPTTAPTTTTTPAAPAATTPAAPAAPAATAGTVSSAAADARATTAATTARLTSPTVRVGKLEDGATVSFNASTGKFSVKNTAGRYVTSPPAIYRAAQAVAAGNEAWLKDAGLGAAGREKLARTLEAGLAAGNDAPAGLPPKQADQQTRSASATLALTMAKGLPDSDPAKGRLVAAYVAQMGKESLKGLKASMALNLEDAVKSGAVRLSAAQQADLAQAKESTLPSKPPYDEWFKNGKTSLNVKQYIHPEFYDAMLNGYIEQGFRITQGRRGDEKIKLEKDYTDPSTGKKTKVNVDVIKTYAEGHKPEKRLFDDMSDKNTDIEFYTGHSNLGGNVLGALAAGPKEQDGSKWVVNWMCRGTQVLADVYNRFPDAHYTTTTDPAYVVHSGKFLGGMFQGIAERKGYDDMWNKMGDTKLWFGSRYGEQLKDWFTKPNDPRILGVRDLDKDGRVDLSKLSGMDPLYNIGQKKVTESAPRLQPQAVTANPADLPGDKVMRGVNFLNTILVYHQDEAEHPGGNDRRLPAGVGDKIYAGGWYKSDGDEIVKVDEKTVGGKTVYEVKVNSKYANQDVDSLGAAIAYEVNKHLTVKKNGDYTENDKLRGALLAGEYLSYMCDTYEEVSGISRALQQKYGFNSRLTFENISAAIEADDKGYVSPDAIRELKRRIGSADPRIG